LQSNKNSSLQGMNTLSLRTKNLQEKRLAPLRRLRQALLLLPRPVALGLSLLKALLHKLQLLDQVLVGVELTLDKLLLLLLNLNPSLQSPALLGCLSHLSPLLLPNLEVMLEKGVGLQVA